MPPSLHTLIFIGATVSDIVTGNSHSTPILLLPRPVLIAALCFRLVEASDIDRVDSDVSVPFRLGAGRCGGHPSLCDWLRPGLILDWFAATVRRQRRGLCALPRR